MKYLKISGSDKNILCGKLVCVGRNYAAHARELGNEVPSYPILFLKTSTCIIDSGENVIHPDYSNELHHEIELVLLITKKIKNANDKEAEEAIGGYAVGLDMTLRDLQNQFRKEGNPWTLSKVFDTSAVLSPIVLKENYTLKQNENIFLNVNGIQRQNSTLDKMLFNPVEIVKYISTKMTLEEGDLIFTGTPEGVGKVVSGDILNGGIEGIGTIETKVISNKGSSE